MARVAGGHDVTAPFFLGEEVRDALDGHAGVVALETSVIGQGLPSPRNAECIDRMSAAVRAGGCVPAWIGVADGEVVVGLTPAQLERFAAPGAVEKVARRDLPMAVASKALGATTVSATIWAAEKAGITVGATVGSAACIGVRTPTSRPTCWSSRAHPGSSYAPVRSRSSIPWRRPKGSRSSAWRSSATASTGSRSSSLAKRPSSSNTGSTHRRKRPPS